MRYRKEARAVRYRTSRRLFLAGMLLAIVGVAASIAIITQTAGGRGRVLDFTLATLGGQIRGTFTVERLSGNIFTGARAYGVVIRERDGTLFLRADSVYAHYRLPSLLATQLAIKDLVFYDAAVEIYRLPTDSLWNYQRIFSDTSSGPKGPPERTISIGRLTLADVDVRVRLPWEPEDTVPGRAQTREIREALADTSQLVVARVPGGYLRTVLLEDLHARATDAFFPLPVGRGSYLRIDRLAGSVYFYRRPIPVRAARGEIAMRDSLIEVQAPEVWLPRSRLALEGVVTLSAGENRFDFDIRSDTAVLADFAWLYPPFGRSGSGSFRVGLETRPGGGNLFAFSELRLALPGTRVWGSLGVTTGDTVRFVDADLHADPLDVDVMETLLPEDLPVHTLRVGSAAAGGSGT
ncbi:MAG: hypothetical protein ACR2F9_03185 [Longimicrobiaceae bacterium]